MNKRQIIASLNKIANELDFTGLYSEANTLTKIMTRLAQGYDSGYDDFFSDPEETRNFANEPLEPKYGTNITSDFSITIQAKDGYQIVYEQTYPISEFVKNKKSFNRRDVGEALMMQGFGAVDREDEKNGDWENAYDVYVKYPEKQIVATVSLKSLDKDADRIEPIARQFFNIANFTYYKKLTETKN
jgi:hypothetical protein